MNSLLLQVTILLECMSSVRSQSSSGNRGRKTNTQKKDTNRAQDRRIYSSIPHLGMSQYGNHRNETLAQLSLKCTESNFQEPYRRWEFAPFTEVSLIDAGSLLFGTLEALSTLGVCFHFSKMSLIYAKSLLSVFF